MAVRNAQEMQDWLQEILMRVYDEQQVDPGECNEWSDMDMPDATPFAETGLMTRDKGLVLRFENGAEFQLTIVCSQRPQDDDDDEDNGEE